MHEHSAFFEIRYPGEIIKQINDKIIEKSKFNNVISSFYILLNNSFFDNKGNIKIKPFDNHDIINLKPICKYMNKYNASPILYFNEYQKTFINNEIKKLDNESKEIIYEKIKFFIVKLTEN